jgi:hypothetical protein
MANKQRRTPVLTEAGKQEASNEQSKVAFDAWWAMNEKNIPAHHHKEIVQADFSARGLTSMETTQAYNEALKKYGLKLN